jgi:hypothetical protein
MSQPEGRTLWDRVGESLQEWYTEAMGWTGEKARIGVKKMDILGIQHNIKRSMTHLGGRVYDLMQRGVAVETDEQVQRIVGELRGFEDELAAREREIDALRSGRRPGEEPSNATTPGSAEAAATETVAAIETANGDDDPKPSTSQT